VTTRTEPERKVALANARLEQRDFLLNSLADLEAEFDAGDLDEADYQSLRADYTKRAADLIRRIEAQESAEKAVTGTPWRTAIAWLAIVTVIGGFAWIFLVQFSGDRSAGGTITGSVRLGPRALLFEAQQTFGGGDLPGAIEVYDQVLELQPSNVEALAYKGWLIRLEGDIEPAKVLVDDAVAIDPEYPDARVFAAVLAMDSGNPEEAASHLAVLDTLDSPPFVQQLVESMGLRERVDAALAGEPISGGVFGADPAIAIRQREALDKVAPVMMVENPPSFAGTGFSVAEVLDASEALASDGELVDAVRLVDQVLAERPDDVEALAQRGWLIARTQNTELLAAGLSYLDRSLELQPDYAYGLVYRSFSRQFAGDTDGARVDLEAFDTLEQKPSDLVKLIDSSPLRRLVG